MSCVVSGDMMGEVWRELAVVTEDADTGTGCSLELRGGSGLVWTWFGFAYREYKLWEE